MSGKEESQQTKKGQEKQISEKHVAAVAGLFLDREIMEIINNELYDFFLNSRGNGNFKIFLPKSGMASLWKRFFSLSHYLFHFQLMDYSQVFFLPGIERLLFDSEII